MEGQQTEVVHGLATLSISSENLVAIITARGGSKGLPGKNTIDLEGKPLIAYSIEAALQCPYIGRCIVSTEDAEIKRISREYGAEVFERPIELATDEALSSNVVVHVLNQLQLEGQLPLYFILLQPTSPLRNSDHITRCVDTFVSARAKCAISVTEVEHHPYKSFCIKDGKLTPLFDAENLQKPRQLLPLIYRQNGAMYLMESAVFLEKQSFFASPAIPFPMAANESIDIDTYYDLELAASVLREKRGGV